MSMGNTSENNFMLLLFNNTNWANVGDATGLRGSSTAGSFYPSLHTATVGETGTQTTSEISYTGYARPAVARSGAAWTVSANSVSNAASISMGACTSGSGTATDTVLGRDGSGTGEALFNGALTASLAISAGITPSFAIGAYVCQID